MTTSKIVTIPPDAVSSTWMRTNLGWGHNPNNPCEYSWTWGDVVDLEIEITPLKVCIDPGHGGSDPGAVGYNGDAYPNEEDINLDIALKLKALSEAKNIKVIMTRATDTTVTLQQRCDIANNNNCDIFVSIHCNSHEKESAHGTETYYYPGSVKGLDLAKHVQSELVKQIGLTDRGTKSETYYVLKHTNMPAALTEVAFISNQTEFNLLSDSAFRQKAAQGIANGILEYFKKKGLTITAYSPVDLVVTDPDGLTISNQLNEILGATYTETDINGDGDPDDQIRIPDRKIGDYFITVIPEPDASPTDTYTLEALVDAKTVILAEDIQISDIPSQPYIIESTKLVALTGNYWDYGADIDSNGVFDYLTVDVEVNPANAGNVVASARLMDSNGEEIIWATNTAWLDAGLPQNIQLNFDGRYLYGNMVDGPYYVRDIYVYHTGDPTLPDYVYDAHTTAAYSYTEFEGSGVITGTVTDAGMPVQNAFISISGGDSDYTNAAGEYNLVVLQDGTYTVNIEATGYDSWKIFVNSEYVTDGNSVDVSASIGEVTYVDFTQEIVDTEPPTIESVTLDAYTTIPDATIHVTIEATDNEAVTSVTAGGVALVETGSIWEGDITAPSTTGDYTLTIRAEDAARNFADATVDYSVVIPTGGLGVAILPKVSSASAGSILPLEIKVISTENFDDVIHVYLTTEGIPASYQADLTWFSWTDTIVQIPAGGGIMLPIEVQIPLGESGPKYFFAKAESTNWNSDAKDWGRVVVTP